MQPARPQPTIAPSKALYASFSSKMRYLIALLTLLTAVNAQFGGFFDQMFGGGGGNGNPHEAHQQGSQQAPNNPSDASLFRQRYEHCKIFFPILFNLLHIFLREISETNSFVLYQQPTATSSSAPTHWPACTSLTIARAPSTHTRKSSSSPRARGYASQGAGSSQARPLAKSSWRGRGCCRRGDTLEALIWVYDKRHCFEGIRKLDMSVQER